MGVIIRQSLISTILTYLGVIIGFVNFLILFPAYMSLEQVGLVRTLQDAAMLMVPFAQLGVSQLTIKFFPEYKNTKFYSEFVSLIFILFGVAIIIFTIAFFAFKINIIDFFATNSSLVNDYLFYIFGLTVLLALHQVLVSFAQSMNNIVLPNFLKEVLLRLLTLINIVLFALRIIDFSQFIFILIGGYILSFLILAFYLAKNKLFEFTLRFKHIKRSTIERMVSYSLFTFLGMGGMLIIGKIDSLMVASMLGLDSAAIYTTAFYIAVLIELPKRAVSQIGLPIISKAIKRNDTAEVKTIYSKSSINNLIIGSLLLIGIWINLDSIYSLIPKSKVYSLGKWVVLIVGIGKLADMTAGLNGEIIIMSKYFRFNVYLVLLLTVFTVSANYILIPIYGLEGAATGSALALVFFNLSKFVFLYRKEGIQPFSFQTLKVIAITALTLLVGLNAPTLDNTYVDIIYRSALVTVLFAGQILWLKPSEDVNNIINNIWAKLKR